MGADVTRKVSWCCLTDSGQWYMNGPAGEPVQETQERVRTILGESAMDEARRTREVVMVTMETFRLRTDEFVRETNR